MFSIVPYIYCLIWQLLRLRFTDELRGIGGRVDFKRVDGTHVTPNVPPLHVYLAQLDPQQLDLLGLGDAAATLRDASLKAHASLWCLYLVDTASR